MADTYGAKAGIRVPDSYPAANQWDQVLSVVTSDATTTGQSLVDITGLAVAVVHGAVYEFEASLLTVASADTNGMEVGVHLTQTPVTVECTVEANTTTTTVTLQGIQAVDTASGAVNTSNAGKGHIFVRGFVTTHATLDSTLSIQHLKVTSGTSTVKVGSTLKIRKVG